MLLGAGLLAALGATAAIVFEHRRLLQQSGLTGEYRAGAGWEGTPDFTTIDNDISAALVRRRSRERQGSAFTVTWRGYLVVPARDRYRFSILADDLASIEIDRRPVIEGDRTRREGSIELARGLHPVTIRYYDGFGLQDLDIRWADAAHPHQQIPRLLLVPQLISADDVQRRTQVDRWSPALPLIWSAIAIGAVTMLIVYRCTFAGAIDRRIGVEMAVIYLAAAAVFTVGISWGLPDYRGWVVDEITPGQVEDILQHRFAGEWATKYPPVHFGLLALVSMPVYAAAAAGLVDDTLQMYSQRFLIGRALSVGMALSILAFVYRLTRDEFGHRSARFAVIAAILVLPLTYYAKTANVDVPYLFWLTASWLFYVRTLRTGNMMSACLFAVCGAAAIATKDQAYGFYVLPAAHLVFMALRRPRPDSSPARPDRRTVFVIAAVSLGSLLVFFNVPFNLAGVREHFRLIAGPASQPFRMYASTVSGYVQMIRDSIWQVGSAMSWPMLAFALCGVADAFRARALVIQRLLLSALSYYLTFVAVVMYHYDRFFLGICLVLAIATGAWLDRWTRAGRPYRRLRLGLVGLAVVYGAARIVSLDALMLLDSRYYVERWLAERIRPDTRIAAEGSSIYLPRQSVLLWTRIGADAIALRTERPDFLILNAGYRTRASEEPGPSAFYRSLDDGSAHYRQALRYRAEWPFSVLRWEPRFNGRDQDPFSNVSKVNPLIEVYERIDGPRTQN